MTLMQPFWRGDVMRDESCLFVRRRGGPAQARLLLPCVELVAITDASGDVRYQPGVDVILGDDGRTLTLAEDSAAPWLAESALYPPPGAPDAIPYRVGGDRWLLFSESTLFAERQVRVTYRHAGWEGPVPAAPCLPRTQERLRQGRLAVVLYGDSIAAGANATALYDLPPRQPPFGSLVAARLEAAGEATVAYANLSVGGMDSDWGLQHVDAVTAREPDLVLLAWGMNDASGGRAPSAFADNVRAQMAAVRAARPGCDLVLVAGMWGNPEWVAARPDLYPAYRDALAALADGPDVALADLTTLWGWMLKRKRYLDLTGNGVNHPNDFCHRLYADVISAAILGEGA